MLLARIYEEQSKIDTNATGFSEKAVQLGMNNFCQTFEYELFYPKMSIKDVVNRILKVGKIDFTISDLASATKKSQQTASNWIRTMKNVGFVEETKKAEKKENRKSVRRSRNGIAGNRKTFLQMHSRAFRIFGCFARTCFWCTSGKQWCARR